MFYDIAKRILDVILTLILIVFFLPIWLAVPILIKLDSPGPVFADTPKRVGRKGKLFEMYKFRSMVKNAHRLLRNDPGFKKLYKKYKKNSYKLKYDPRVTRVGRFLRRFSLDEAPQFVNVLKGEMSLVGPRAYYPDELEKQQKKYPQTKKYVKILLQTRPGITGYWQVAGRSEINFDKRVKMDADYVRQRSIWYDLWIIARTPLAMMTGKGAL
jgi:lipopolysaccharide/colanic/teichoic acid biosynthesis glycosyltransferase